MLEDKIIDLLKTRALIKYTIWRGSQMKKCILDRMENIVGIGENAVN